ncbi:DUF4936 family protein [Ideonella dechloratans]|uniref:DUF4936 family protein n=1 Tax=Ideonella dechloratans TaxID=36863 RepID=A0A643FGF2_IDEDE|nr:DUF4936 family protein [Ideonella dechloratans]KAB0584239.1 DUF4936 family protein [Ideonella dechloratans]UFU08586.1 DUF4936 family protein [Ideonella dechloratans]
MSHESPADAPSPGRLAAEWFIYYQIATADLPQALEAVIGFQQRLQQDWPGLSARVLQRLEASGTAAGRLTLMEIYRFTPRAPASVKARANLDFDTALAEAARDVQPWLQGPRHVESFVPCAS